jgi:hypothetical protein
VILLDSDVLLIELRYKHDPRFARNQQALIQMTKDGIGLAIVLHTLLEVVGNMSFGVSKALIPGLPQKIIARLNLQVIPDAALNPGYAGCTFAELVAQMGHQMALADAVQAVQIAHHAPTASCLLTWNARHFVGKLIIPVLTPEEWLNQRQASTP